MREETRYRVTGSIFLLALAVISLPMLLDGAGLPAKSLPDLTMDDEPPEARRLSARAPESDFMARVEQLREQVDEDGFLTDSGTRFGEPVLTPTEAGSRGEGSEGSERDAGAVQTDGGVTRAIGRVGASEGTGAWAVQVASFAQADNAEDFRARLRKDGYEAFISTAKSDDRVLSRVAVGPLLDRQRAETLRGELSARYDVQARLMAFSN